MTSTTIVWICASLLFVIFVIAMIGIFHANKAFRTTSSVEKVACAGSVDNSYANTVKIRLPHNPMKTGVDTSKRDLSSLARFIVKGNSMQYANINSDDLVYVRETDVDSIRKDLPKITLLSFTPKSPGMADRKIRRTWSIIKSDVCDRDFDEILNSILNTPEFFELRNRIGDKCPSNDMLKKIAIDSLDRYRQKHSSDTIEDLLLSTTFRSEQNRIEFSIHPASALQGVVAYVSHPISSQSA
ncbi:MAG: hypothetical protein K2N35_12470 [Muribaculaceae bacterium]|nr:hypothetical protein [Muribaculaceae bacterium]